MVILNSRLGKVMNKNQLESCLREEWRNMRFDQEDLFRAKKTPAASATRIFLRRQIRTSRQIIRDIIVQLRQA